MDDIKELVQRYGGHLVLISVVVLLFLTARKIPLSEIFDFELEPEAEQQTAIAVSESLKLAREAGNPSVQPVADLSSVPVLVNYSFSPALRPRTFEGKRPSLELITYTVEPLDTPIGIAEQFGIKPETLLGGNPFLSEESGALQPGTVLIILPVDGVLHDVGEGETLESVARLYGVPPEDIIAYAPNNLEFPYRLYADTQIVVPGAVREVFVWTAPSAPSRSSTSDSTGSGISPLIQGTGTFMWPVSYRRITQQYWYGHQAIDIGLPEGNTVLASDTGTVTWAGWNVYGYGNLIVVNHGNGYETYYGHLSRVDVVPGQIVYKGNAIGASGNTGRSSGPHLHFEIRYFNQLYQPLNFLP